MTVILMILRIVGIALLVILGLLLAVVLAVLFVPVRYRADGSFHEAAHGIGACYVVSSFAERPYHI